MPDPAKVKAAVIGAVLVIGASIGVGIGVTQKKKNKVSDIVQKMNSVTPRNSDEATYIDSDPTNVKDILDETAEQTSARYGGYMDYGNNPLEGERGWNDDVDDDGGGWRDDGWDDDGWNDDGYNLIVGSPVTQKGSKAEKVGLIHGLGSIYGNRSSKSSKENVGGSKAFKHSTYSVSISNSKEVTSAIYFDASSKSNKESSVISFGGGSKSSKGTGIPAIVTSKSGKGTPGIIHFLINGEPTLKPESSWGSTWGNAWSDYARESLSPTSRPTRQNFRGKWSDDGFPLASNPVMLAPLTQDMTVSSSPTTCKEHKWHPDLAYTMCTNDLNIQPGLADEFYLFSSRDECCMAFFGVGACEYNDICTTSSPPTSLMTSELTNSAFKPAHSHTNTPPSSPTVTPSSSPTSSPTKIPTSPPNFSITTSVPSPFPTGCETRMLWHPNPFFNFCTNDSNYPTNWVTPDLYEQYFYGSLTECCQASFGTLECKYVDICVMPPPSTSPSSAPSRCEERNLWHPNIGFNFCTNDSNYPISWTNQSVADKYFHESLEKCCISVFATREECKYYDVCNPPSPTESPIAMIVTIPPSLSPTPCEGRKWYALDANNKLICSNGNDVPPSWTGSEYYYDDLEACCTSVFGLLEDCEYFDMCATPAHMESPVLPEPTRQPSPQQNSNLTPKPTPDSTAKPMLHPVTLSHPCEVQEFFFDGNTCTNEINSHGASTYGSLMVCCDENFGSGSLRRGICSYNDICSPDLPTIMHTTIITTPPSKPLIMCDERKWHATLNADNLLICSNGQDTPVDSSDVLTSGDYYINLQACCEAEFGTYTCVFEDVCVTSQPSSELKYPLDTVVLTPCEAQVFFFVGNTCTNKNEGFVDFLSFTSVIACCNSNFGVDSYINGSCTYVDDCSMRPSSSKPTQSLSHLQTEGLIAKLP